MQPVINRLKDFKIASCFQKLWTSMSFFFIKELFVVKQKMEGLKNIWTGGWLLQKRYIDGEKIEIHCAFMMMKCHFLFFSIPIPNCLFDWI